jgi:hypothetical protein
MPLPLTTERLLLRPPTLDDLPAWHAIFVDAEEAWHGAPHASMDENKQKLLRHVASRRVLEKCRTKEIGLTHVYGLEHVKYELRR